MSERTHDCLPNTFYPRWSEMLRDHRHVLIRPIHVQDMAAERAFIDGLSQQARRFRFLGQIGHPTERLVEQLTDIDYAHEMAFVAVARVDGVEKIVGVSRYSADEDNLQCECAVTVAEDWQHQGLGALLMKHLIEVARDRGISRMFSLDSAENVAMNDLARFLGFTTRPDPDDAGQVIHELDLQEKP